TAQRPCAKPLIFKHNPPIAASLGPPPRLNAAPITPKKAPRQHPDVARDQALAREMWQKPKPIRNGIAAMNLKRAAALLATGIAPAAGLPLVDPTPARAQPASGAAAHIETYYQQMMPTIKQAGRLTVRERDKRFGPAITSAFDFATMTRLAV